MKHAVAVVAAVVVVVAVAAAAAVVVAAAAVAGQNLQALSFDVHVRSGVVP